jgi:hypothetical protein
VWELQGSEMPQGVLDLDLDLGRCEGEPPCSGLIPVEAGGQHGVVVGCNIATLQFYRAGGEEVPAKVSRMEIAQQD